LGCLRYVVLFGILVWVIVVSFALGILSVSYRTLSCIVGEFLVIVFGPCEFQLTHDSSKKQKKLNKYSMLRIEF
jgi:hypothetical protein